MAAKDVVLALVGGAHIHTPNFANIIAEREGVSVKYVWDHDQTRVARYTEQFGCSAGSLDAIWSDPEIGGVVICSETDRHHGLVLAAAKAGKHMFVEKPLGASAMESFEMASAIEKAGVCFTTGYFMRTTPIHLFLKDQIERGSFGEITRVRGSTCHGGSINGWFDTEWRWMADPAIAGVGAFGDLGTHSLDLLMWLVGGVESVTADIRIVTNRYEGCDECGEALLKFDNGITGTLAGSWVDVANPMTLLISGTEGHASVVNGQLFFQSKHVDGADGKEPWTNLPEAGILPIHQFMDAVSGAPGDTLVKPSEAAARVAVMEAAYKAAGSRTWETVAKG